MIDITLIPVLQPTIPSYITKNPHGVYTRGLRWVVYAKPNSHLDYLYFDVIFINGGWIGAMSGSYSTGGFASPLMDCSDRYGTLEKCVESLWGIFSKFYSQRIKWMNSATLKFKEWQNSTDKMSYFKETDFYAL